MLHFSCKYLSLSNKIFLIFNIMLPTIFQNTRVQSCPSLFFMIQNCINYEKSHSFESSLLSLLLPKLDMISTFLLYHLKESLAIDKELTQSEDTLNLNISLPPKQKKRILSDFLFDRETFADLLCDE